MDVREDLLAGRRAVMTSWMGRSSGPEPAAGDDLKSRAVPGDRDIVSGDQSRGRRSAGGAIAPATIRGDRPTSRQFRDASPRGRNYYARA